MDRLAVPWMRTETSCLPKPDVIRNERAFGSVSLLLFVAAKWFQILGRDTRSEDFWRLSSTAYL